MFQGYNFHHVLNFRVRAGGFMLVQQPILVSKHTFGHQIDDVFESINVCDRIRQIGSDVADVRVRLRDVHLLETVVRQWVLLLGLQCQFVEGFVLLRFASWRHDDAHHHRVRADAVIVLYAIILAAHVANAVHLFGQVRVVWLEHLENEGGQTIPRLNDHSDLRLHGHPVAFFRLAICDHIPCVSGVRLADIGHVHDDDLVALRRHAAALDLDEPLLGVDGLNLDADLDSVVSERRCSG